jgi:hypothetical protein
VIAINPIGVNIDVAHRLLSSAALNSLSAAVLPGSDFAGKEMMRIS